MNTQKPLADRMRPQKLSDYIGQSHLVGEGKILKDLINNDKVPSMILWGPPGSGKTTLARIIAHETEAYFIEISAISSGVKEVRKSIEMAKSYARLGTKTMLFIDEVHRFTKSQQDSLLGSVEDGTITLIGATTENPSFEVNNALLSRCRVFVLEMLSVEEMQLIIKQALSDKDRGLGELNVNFKEESIKYLATLSNGDARTALNSLEIAVEFSSRQNKSSQIKITKEHIEQALQKSNLLYDKNGEEHFNLISAFHKSMRGGDADASVYYLTRMLAAGEDPLYIARRIVRFASEDIGLANSFALPQAISVYEACKFIGMPECGVNLAQAAVYMAKSKKSVVIYDAYNEALKDSRELGNVPIPKHLRNAPTKLMKQQGYGKGYVYTPKASEEENKNQEFLPKELKNKKYLID